MKNDATRHNRSSKIIKGTADTSTADSATKRTIGSIVGTPKKNGSGLEMVRLSKDEMNLVEYPFAALWRSQDRDVVINHEWQAQHPDTGKALKALWRVQGDSELGLPTSNDEKVYLVLLEITREAGFEQKVFFTSYDLIKRLNWPDNQQSYQMLFQAFQRLKAVTITAHNTFWNPRARAFRNVVFSILDNVDITPEKKGRRKAGEQIAPMSFFKWNDVIHDSFQNGYIRSIDLAFVLSLKGDITRRLYRYLDKKKHDGRRTFEIELPILCTRHLGMKPSPYPSKLKERLKTAHEELLAHGFLREVTFLPMKSRVGEKVCYRFAGQALPAHQPVENRPVEEMSPRGDISSEGAADGGKVISRAQREPQLEGQVSHAEVPAEVPGRIVRRVSTPDRTPDQAAIGSDQPELMQRLVDVGVSPAVARELFISMPAEQIALQLDCLVDREPKNPPATLVTALRQNWAPPPKYLDRLGAAAREQKARAAAEARKGSRAAQEASRREETASLERESAQLDAVWERMEPAERDRIDTEARRRLGVLGHAGRAQGALMAMRRNLLRQKLTSEG